MIALAVCIALVAAAALAGSRFRPDAWYAALRKPAFNPPKGVFAPVWTTLYVAIAVAGWRVWTDNGGAISTALVLWCVQLALNAAWSWLFFGRHRVGAALVDVAALLAVIGGFIFAAAPISALAAWLFVPYALWVAFATLLNASILALNRGHAVAGGAPMR